MSMAPFYTYFPDIAVKETRSATIHGMPEMPDGQYSFIEYYCVTPNCDCRRVLIHVLRSDTEAKVWASINYGWEPVAFYRHWLGDKKLAQAAKGPELDPLNPQTPVAPLLLNLFTTMLEDKAYVRRLSQHYAMVKQAVTPRKPTIASIKTPRGRKK